jgi:hypothetical protein
VRIDEEDRQVGVDAADASQPGQRVGALAHELGGAVPGSRLRLALCWAGTLYDEEHPPWGPAWPETAQRHGAKGEHQDVWSWLAAVRAMVTLCDQHEALAVRAVDRFVDRATGETGAMSVMAAWICGIRAGSALRAPGQASHNPPVVDSGLNRPSTAYARAGSWPAPGLANQLDDHRGDGAR